MSKSLTNSIIGSSWSWQATLITLMVGGHLVLSRHVETSRPADPPQLSARHNDHSIMLRLWQDPLEASRKLRSFDGSNLVKSNTSHNSPFKNIAEKHLTHVVSNRTNVCIILYSMSDRPYAHSAESRMRSRVALHHAMSLNEYLPRWWDRVYGLIDTNGNILVVEAFYHKTNTNSVVVVFWIEEETLDLAPLRSLNKYRRYITSVLSEACESKFKWRFIGPRYSQTLQRMMIECESSNQNEFSNKLEIHSPFATSHDVIRNDPEKWKKLLVNNSMTFTSYGSSDDELIEAVTVELKHRHIQPEGSKKILLLHEQDSVYGQSLKESFIKHWTESNAVAFTYLSGIDGRAPGASTASTAAMGATASPLGKADGPAQVDYITRLLEELNSRSWRKKEGRIAAVGLLGGDAYDKLMLAQAVRQVWPAMVIFTTDLDARLLGPPASRWTRNMIVASSYALWDSERRLPSLRDSYQGAQIDAISSALQTNSNNQYLSNTPLIFETGRRFAHPLDLDMGEPRSWPTIVDGISAWPAIILRWVGIVIGGIILWSIIWPMKKLPVLASCFTAGWLIFWAIVLVFYLHYFNYQATNLPYRGFTAHIAFMGGFIMSLVFAMLMIHAAASHYMSLLYKWGYLRLFKRAAKKMCAIRRYALHKRAMFACGHTTQNLRWLLYWPFLYLMYLIILRSPLFDLWQWEYPLVFSASMAFAVLLLPAIALSGVASYHRLQAIAAIKAADKKWDHRKKDRLDLLEGYNEGVCSSLLNQPLLGALIFPLMGYYVQLYIPELMK